MDDLKFLRQSYYFLDDLGALLFKLFWKYVFSLASYRELPSSASTWWSSHHPGLLGLWSWLLEIA
jgi:hypothetical protein